MEEGKPSSSTPYCPSPAQWRLDAANAYIRLRCSRCARGGWEGRAAPVPVDFRAARGVCCLSLPPILALPPRHPPSPLPYPPAASPVCGSQWAPLRERAWSAGTSSSSRRGPPLLPGSSSSRRSASDDDGGGRGGRWASSRAPHLCRRLPLGPPLASAACRRLKRHSEPCGSTRAAARARGWPSSAAPSLPVRRSRMGRARERQARAHPPLPHCRLFDDGWEAGTSAPSLPSPLILAQAPTPAPCRSAMAPPPRLRSSLRWAAAPTPPRGPPGRTCLVTRGSAASTSPR